MYTDSTYRKVVMIDDTQATNNSLSNFFDSINTDTVLSIVVTYCVVCGIVAALVARYNGRSIALGFLSGFFFGPFGIMTHMIMGEKR